MIATYIVLEYIQRYAGKGMHFMFAHIVNPGDVAQRYERSLFFHEAGFFYV